MSEAKFTKGLWETGAVSWNDANEVQYTLHDIFHANAADAHLIAAAPDLYEALYRLTRDCEIAGLQEQAGFDCWIIMANAALAKARGEAQ